MRHFTFSFIFSYPFPFLSFSFLKHEKKIQIRSSLLTALFFSGSKSFERERERESGELAPNVRGHAYFSNFLAIVQLRARAEKKVTLSPVASLRVYMALFLGHMRGWLGQTSVQTLRADKDLQKENCSLFTGATQREVLDIRVWKVT